MFAFRILLVVIFVGMAVYTAVAGAAHGADLVSVFFGDIAALDWSGQFNLDFLSYLLLSALWVAWRHRFTPTGLALAAVASVGGALFFAPYLLIASVRAKGDVSALLLGPARAAD